MKRLLAGLVVFFLLGSPSWAGMVIGSGAPGTGDAAPSNMVMGIGADSASVLGKSDAVIANAIMGIVADNSTAQEPASGVVGTIAHTSTTETLPAIYANFSGYTTTTAGTVNYIHLYVPDGNGATACLSIADATLDTKASCTTGTIPDGVAGWYSCKLDAPVTLAAAVDYVLIVKPSADIITGRITGSGIAVDGTPPACGGDVTVDDVLSGAEVISIIANNTAEEPEVTPGAGSPSNSVLSIVADAISILTQGAVSVADSVIGIVADAVSVLGKQDATVANATIGVTSDNAGTLAKADVSPSTATLALVAGTSTASSGGCNTSTTYVGNSNSATPYTTQDSAGTDYMICYYTASNCAGTLNVAHAYNDHAATAANVKVAVYTKGTGTPSASSTLVESSGAIATGSTTGWKTSATMSTGVTVDNYFICLITQDSGWYWRAWASGDAGSGVTYYYTGDVSGAYATPPANLAGLAGAGTGQGPLSMYIDLR